MSKQFFSAKKLIKLTNEDKCSIPTMVLKAESELTGRTEDEIKKNMAQRLELMRKSINFGLKGKKSLSGMLYDEGKKMYEKINDKNMVGNKMILRAVSYALSIMNCNASLGRIVAAPTAGSSGVLPGIIFAYLEEKKAPLDLGVKALLTASGIGLIIANKATFSAAKAGCQAEIGVSSAMAASALSYMRGMSVEQCVDSAGLALKNFLGLACDPVAGLVEVPCAKRNAFAVSHAFMASDIFYSGIKSVIPFDEIFISMNDVGRSMSTRIKETAQCGLAMTKTGKKL